MKVQVLFFGIALDYSSAHSTILEIDENSTVKDLKIKLINQFPKLKNLTTYAIAVNENYALDDLYLNTNDTIAIIPPVSGG